MKRINNIFCVLILFFSASSCAQKSEKLEPENTFHSEKIKDSVFHNVIEIKDTEMIKNGEDYLFTVPISKKYTLPVLFITEEVPLNILPKLYPEFSNLIVITPNWTYYDAVSKDNRNNGINCAEPMASSVVYEFKREDGKLLKDSLVIMGGKGFPELKFATDKKLMPTEKAIYFKESYASSCCPKDEQWNEKPSREEFVKLFEKENKTAVITVYKETRGKEGEAVYYYPLDQLSDVLKLKFIQQRNSSKILNRESKKIKNNPRIYTPEVVEIDNSIRKM